MQVILDSSFARPGSAPIWGGKKGEFRDWTDKWVCPATLFCAILFVCLFCCCNTAKPRDGEKRKAYIHPVSEEVYDTLLLLAQGKFEVPVSKWTRIQRNTVVPVIPVGPKRTPSLYFARKKVVKKSLISTIVGNTFKQTKSGGFKLKATISSRQQLC